MKKILLLTMIFAGTYSLADAQTGQGRLIAGGGVTLDFSKFKSKVGSTTSDDGKSTTIIFNPLVGYFVIDGLAIGAEINLTSSKFKPDGGGESTTSSFSLGPFVKYYHSSGLFGMGSFGFGSGKNKTSSNGSSFETKTGNFQWRLGAGYAAFLNDNVSVEPMLSYGSMSTKIKDSDPEQKDIRGSLMISVAFTIFLDL